MTTPQSKPRGAPYYVKNNPSKKKEGMFENVDNGDNSHRCIRATQHCFKGGGDGYPLF